MPAAKPETQRPPRGTEDAKAARRPSWSAVETMDISPLAWTMGTGDQRVSRKAKRTMLLIVRSAGRPGADARRRKVAADLAGLCRNEKLPTNVKRDILWMLSEVADEDAVDVVAKLLSNTALREDARMVLERIPGEKSLAVLKTAMADASDDFKPNLAQSLRKRGVKVSGWPCQKLTPVKQTEFKPVGR